jgi:hypothetical protein
VGSFQCSFPLFFAVRDWLQLPVNPPYFELIAHVVPSEFQARVRLLFHLLA